MLAAHVPRARIVTAADANELWSSRTRYFFKPFAGYASRGAYRGERITHRVWADILAAGNYIAQEYAPPASRRGTPDAQAAPLKFDLRCITYGTELK